MGAVFIVSGYLKLNAMPGTIGYFAKLGFPVPPVTGWFIALLEFFGGFGLILGLCVRYLGALYTIEFLVATVYVKFFLQGFREGRLDMMLFAGGMALFFLGAGPLSIDSVWLEKDRR